MRVKPLDSCMTPPEVPGALSTVPLALATLLVLAPTEMGQHVVMGKEGLPPPPPPACSEADVLVVEAAEGRLATVNVGFWGSCREG